MSSSVIHLKRPVQGLFMIMLCLSLFALHQGTVQAATYSVTSASDAQTTCGPAPNGTLRWAVCSAVVAGDVISINPGLTITLGAALPQLTNIDLTIQGDGSTIDGGTLKITNSTLSGSLSIHSLQSRGNYV